MPLHILNSSPNFYQISPLYPLPVEPVPLTAVGCTPTQVDVALSLVEVYSEGSASQIRDLLVSGTPRVHIRNFALVGATEVHVADAARIQVTRPAL